MQILKYPHTAAINPQILHVPVDLRMRETVFKMDAKIIILLCFLASVLVDAGQSSDSKVNKLQIGVKKRVENCVVKSKNGDKLQMHYTVR